jgi:hypothetical protein
MSIDQAARHCGVSVGMLSKLGSGKGVNLEHACAGRTGFDDTRRMRLGTRIRSG